mgnify:CR=1 FL=1
MAVYRANKHSGYTQISNELINNTYLSSKATMLLIKMLSKPKDWHFTIDGLVDMCKEGRTAVKSALKELEDARHVFQKRYHKANGQIDYDYDVYEIQQKPEFTLSWSHYLILMQMYVNYFDRYVKQDFENPTIGILLCKQKDDALVELILPKDSNIYAQQYALYLPDKKLLQEKLTEWLQDEEVK